MTNSTANDNAGKPLGFGSVLFSAPETTPVVARSMKRAAQESVAFAA